jgi:ATP adenylyltransferase
MRYVGGERSPGCVFCNAIENPEDRQSLVLHVGERVFLILNRFPYNSGHLMIVPIEHVPSIEDLDPETRAEMMELANVAMRVSRAVFRCDGFNLGLNVGQVAGAGIADHMHMHLVPRWMGDANFMPILSDTMVLPETLDATYARLRAELVIDTARSEGNLELAAGALVYAPEANVFAIRQVEDAPAVMPKGKLEGMETAAEAAMREVREETGLDATLVGWLGALVIPAVQDHHRDQCAVFFLATTSDLSLLIDNETVLVRPDDLLNSITIPALRDMLSIAMPSILLMVGHD